WLWPCGDAFAKASRRRANGGPPRESPPHPACFSAASTRDRQVHLYEQSLLASIITPGHLESAPQPASRSLIGQGDLVKSAGNSDRSQVALALGKRICRGGFFGDFAAQGCLSAAPGARPP